ncbi:MAG: NAD-binding protein [Salinibacter sp.]
MADPAKSSRRRWLNGLTLLFGGLTLGFAATGLYESSGFQGVIEEHGSFAAWTNLAMNAVSLLALTQPSSPPQNLLFGIARLSAIAFASTAVFTILFSFSRRLRLATGKLWVRLQARTRPDQAHAVIVGSSRVGRHLLRDLRFPRGERAQRPVMVVAEEGDELGAEAEALGAFVVQGDPRDPEVRAQALMSHAREVFVATGDGAHNVDIAADLLQDYRSGRIARTEPLRSHSDRFVQHLQCHVHLNSPQLESLFQTHDLFQASGDDFDVHTFSMYDQAARELFLNPEYGIVPHCMPESSEVAHYVILGFGAMGQTTALKAAHLAHFPNDRRPRLTIVDRFEEAGETGGEAAERDEFLSRYPAFCPDPAAFDLESHIRESDTGIDGWESRASRPAAPRARVDDSEAVEYVANAEFLSMPVSANGEEWIGELARRLHPEQDPSPRPALVVCYDDERRNARTALQLYDQLSTLPPESLPPSLPIYVYLPTEEGLAKLIDNYGTSNPHNTSDPGCLSVHPFGHRADTDTYTSTTRPSLQKLARGFHQAYNDIYGGDTPYDDLDPTLKTSNERAAAHARVKLCVEDQQVSQDHELEDKPPLPAFDRPGILARMEHNRWMAERLLEGWRYASYPDDYASLSEEEQQHIQDKMDRRKLRATLVPWSALSEEERDKDRQQVSVLRKALAHAEESTY